MNALYVFLSVLALAIYCIATAFVVRQIRSSEVEIPYENLIGNFSLVTFHAAGIAIATILVSGLIF